MAKCDECWPVSIDSAVTKADIAVVSYTWTIKNYSFFANRDVVESTKFSSRISNDLKWCISLHPKGFDENHANVVSIFLHSTASAANEVWATVTFSILNKNDEKTNVLQLSKPHKFGAKTGGWGFYQFIRKDELKKEEEVLLPNDTLKIFCEVKFMINCFTESSDSSFVKIPASQFESDMLNLLKSETLSDVTLFVGRKTFKAHRSILAARSPVFEAMFTVEMKEKNEGTVNFPDVDPDVFYHMLHYIYTGEYPVLTSSKQSCELLAIADKYDLDRLKAICEDDLCSRLTVENVSEILTLANFHCADQLKEIATSFMQIHFSEVQKTVGWISLFRKPPPCDVLNEDKEEIVPVNDVDKNY